MGIPSASADTFAVLICSLYSAVMLKRVALADLCRDHLLSRLKRFFKLSCNEPPVGRLLPFGSGNVETRIHSITEWRSLLPTSQSRIPKSAPYGFTCPNFSGRGYRVSAFRIIDPMSNLGAPYYAGGSTVPCRQLANLQLDHLCKHKETQLRPNSPRRSVAC